MKPKPASSQERDILINAVITLALVTAVGLASNTIILLLGWIITLPAFAAGLANLNDQLLWFTVAAVSQVFCCIFCAYLLTFVGSGAAQFRIGRSLSRKFSSPVMLATVGIGCGIHALLCLFTAGLSTSYLFFAGPVLYISRFIAHAEREFFAYDTDSYRFSIVIAAIVIYILFCAAACCVGYIIGYRRRIASQEEKEAEEHRGTSAEKTWSEKDAGQVSRADEFGHEKPHIAHKHLPRSMESAYRRLNRTRIVKTVFLILGWFALVALLAYLWLSSRENMQITVDAAPFVALLIVPFYPFKLHQRFLGRTFYGQVVRMDAHEEARPGRIRGETTIKRTQILKIRPDLGITEEFRYPANTHFDLAEEDRVLKLSAYPHPIPTWAQDEHGVWCPRCGHITDARGAKRCSWCRETLAKWK
ncbi:MAG: hypothetical protein IJ497_13620 [Clostridia bacterium]|nr:hypothetical protein [Clostridia bacterium]